MTDERMPLAGTLALLAATVAAVFGVALSTDARESLPPTEQDAAQARAGLDPDELLALNQSRAPLVARRVAKLRELEFAEVPEPQLTDSSELRALVEKELAKPRVAATFASGDAALKLLGLLEPSQSLADVSAETTALAAAYYDPRRKDLFVLSDAGPIGPSVAESTLAHELLHALEDQAFGLSLPGPSNDDRALAETALIEGAASAVQRRYEARYLPGPDVFAESLAVAADTSELPPIAVAQVTFAYLTGEIFVDELREAGGSWDLVDFAYEARRPASTEQVIHPEKYLANEKPLPVSRPRAPGDGWKETDSGTVGEFTTREILRHDAAQVPPSTAAAGWGGDRYRLFRREGAPAECAGECRADYALVIAWRGDDVAEAAELREALDDYVGNALQGKPSNGGPFELDGGWAVVAGEGDVATLAFAPDARLATRLARPVE